MSETGGQPKKFLLDDEKEQSLKSVMQVERRESDHFRPSYEAKRETWSKKTAKNGRNSLFLGLAGAGTAQMAQKRLIGISIDSLNSCGSNAGSPMS